MGLFDWFKNKRPEQDEADRETAPVEDNAVEDNAVHLGRWVWIKMPWELEERFLGYVYFDQQAGLSAKGGPESEETLATQPSHTARLPIGPVEPLTAEEVQARRLPTPPEWITFFGEQPAADAAWRSDPQLRDRFHPSFPDDVQVLVHDGEPRRSECRPELCWVRVVRAEPGGSRGLIHNPEGNLSEAELESKYCGDHVFFGRLLNAPHQLESVSQGDEICFLTCTGAEHPVMVTQAYLDEREGWWVMPCDKCGFAECLDPPSVMGRLRFPDTPPDAEVQSFTAFCPMCGGIQLLSRGPGEAPS